MNDILIGDCLKILPTLKAESVQCCVTSPPYWGLRDYGVAGQLGLEATPEEYVDKMVQMFQAIKRILRSDGTLWLNMGDSYRQSGGFGHKNIGTSSMIKKRGRYRQDNIRLDIKRNFGNIKPKDLCGIPWRVAFALQADGWYLRSDIIWHKPNPMPESVTDRPTKSHEYLFLLTKSAKYYYDADAIKEPLAESTINDKRTINENYTNKRPERGFVGSASQGSGMLKSNNGTSNKRTVWTIPTHNFPGSHFATFPPDLVKPCILAGSKAGDLCLDPFSGSGTVGQVCAEFGRDYTGIELNPAYAEMRAEERSVLALPL